MSELSEEREEVTKIFIMDKHIKRKIKPGEETNLEEIAKTAGVTEYPNITIEVPDSDIEITAIKLKISSTDLLNKITRDFGAVCNDGRILITKNSYHLYPDDEIEKVLSEDQTDDRIWDHTLFQSPDFSIVLAGVMKDKLKGIPFGLLFFHSSGISHACNCYYSVDQKKMKVVEPQTDKVYDFSKETCCPILVLI